MKRQLTTFFLLLSLSFTCLQADERITGFWKTIKEETSKTDSIVAVYEHDGKFYGRIIVTFDDEGKVDGTIEAPGGKATGVVGQPPIAGLDILWGLIKKEGGIYKDGHIIDPKEGKIYDADVWREDDHLIVRGEVFNIFGKDIIWPPASGADFPNGFAQPDISKFVPVIPQSQRSK